MSAKSRYLACVIEKSSYAEYSQKEYKQQLALPSEANLIDASQPPSWRWWRPAALHLPRSIWIGALLCLLGVVLFKLSLQVTAAQAPPLPINLPLPVNVPLPDAVYHTDNFGESMAIDGDTLVVGAPWTDVNGIDQQGVVYIFTRNPNDSTGFTLLKSITGSDSGKFHAFGWSVTLNGDTLVVGTGNNGNLTFKGAAYVFQRNHGGENNWGEVKKLVRDDIQFSYFGRTLAINSDTLVVGAWLGLGQVALFQRNHEGVNQWGKTQVLDGGIPITTSPKSASFGYALAFDGARLVISAPKIGLKAEDVPAGTPAPARNFEGATFIYRQENGQWLQEAKLFSSDTDLNNLDPVSVFSSGTPVTSLALNGDLLFVGAPFGKSNGVMTGKVFVYQRGAGTLGSFGQPGGWGEIAILSPSDGVNKDHFGQAIYAVDDGVFVSSEKQGVGKIYFFRNPSGQSTVSAATQQTTQAWSEVYSFSTSTNGESTQFGLPLIGSGNSVIGGDHSANLGRGGSVIYPKDALFAVDPNATPIATPIPTTTPPPTQSEPCASPKIITDTNQIYLPIIQGNGSVSTAATFIEAPEEVAPFVGELRPGCIVVGAGGVRLAALSDTIPSAVAITITISTAPSQTLPVSVTPRGSYFVLNSDHDHFTTMEKPFVIELPVPAGADTAHLALAYLSKAEDVLDVQSNEAVWEFLDGVYDARSASFLTTLSFLSAAGTPLVLVEHPDFASPANGTQIQAAGTRVGAFTVSCEFFSAGECTTSTEEVVAGYLDDIYKRMTDDAGFDFRLPRLRSPISGIILEEGSVSIALTEGYAARIAPRNGYAPCDDVFGYYQSSSGTLTLCFDPLAGINGETLETLTHEYFHATQYAYEKVLADRNSGSAAAWVTEGMATAAEQSYFESTMMLRDLSRPQHDVDRALSAGVRGDSTYEEYQAQDFWVYSGQRGSSGLAYLKSILEVGGASTTGVAAALKTKFGVPFSDLYWGWVKNQVIENQYTLGDGLGERCKLNSAALDGGVPILMDAAEQGYPFNTKSAYDTLPPLTAEVVEIDFGSKTSARITMEYHGCVGLQDPVAKASCETAAQQTLKSKIYVENEDSCEKEELHGWRFLGGLSASKRYFVVVANADAEKDHSYFFWIE